MAAISLPDRLTKLQDFPTSITANKILAGNDAGDATEFVPSPFEWARSWVTAMDYGGSGVIATTTLAAQLNSGSTSATLTDASSFEVGHGMAIPGAGAAGAELPVVLTGIAGNVVSWSGATSTTVATGTTIYHDDTQAFEDALATGKNVYVSDGDYHVTWALEILTVSQCFAGMGMFTNSFVSETIIYPRSLTADVFHLYASSNPTLIGFRLLHTGTPTAGASIIVGRTGVGTNSARIKNISSGLCYYGLIIRDGFNHHVQDCAFNGQKYGTWINTDAPNGGHKFRNVASHGSGTNSTGIYADGSDWILWSMITASGTYAAIHLESSNGLLYGQIFNHVYLDDIDGGSTGVIITKGVNLCMYHSFDDIHGYFRTAGAFGIKVGAGVEHTRFSGGEFTGLYGPGVEDSGTRSVFNDIHLRPSANSTNTYDAFTLKSSSVGAKITGCSGNYSRYGLVMESGVTYATVQDNDFRNNNTGAASIAAGVKATCFIENNQGLTNYGTSIASTPERIGLTAVVGGVAYLSIGTSSSADWKQITA